MASADRVENEVTASRGANAAAISGGQALSVHGLNHVFGTTQVLHDVGFRVRAGEVAALLGPSGCGKTTALRAVAGLVRPMAGRIELGGNRLDNLPTRHRRIGMVFQNYALFPHLTVRENVGYGLVNQGLSRPERRQRVDRMLAMVRLDNLADRLPRELSGGQQQRAAVARALATQPRLLLLDEPFGALDKDLRLDLQIELRRLQRSLAITTIIVTHDQEEALSVADQVLVMRGGRIEQVGGPIEIYDQPRNLFVNLFVGRTSTLRGRIEQQAPGSAVVVLSTGERLAFPRQLNFINGSDVAVCLRPEHVSLAAPGEPDGLAATVTVSLPLGPTIVHELTLRDGTPVKVSEQRTASSRPAEMGAPVTVRLDLARAHVFPASDLPAPAHA